MEKEHREVMDCLMEIVRGTCCNEVVITEQTGEGYTEARAVEVCASAGERAAAAAVLLKYYGADNRPVPLDEM